MLRKERLERLGVVSVYAMGLVWGLVWSSGWERLLGQEVGDVLETLRFARGLFEQKRYQLAADEYRKVLDAGAVGEARADARYGLANSWLLMNRYEESRGAFAAFLRESPGDRRVRTAVYRLGELAYLLGDYGDARRRLEDFTGARGAHPGLELAWTYLGDACFNLGDYEAARRAYGRSLADYPAGRLADRARYGMGRVLAAVGDGKGARGWFDQLVGSGKAEWVDRSWLQIARLERGRGRWVEVVEACRALERSAPESPLVGEARLERAVALARLGRQDEAIQLLEGLAGPGGPESLASQALLEWAGVELERGRTERARELLESGLKRYGAGAAAPALRFRLAEVLARERKLAEAQAAYEAVARLEPADPWSDDAALRAARLSLERQQFEQARKLASELEQRFPQSPLIPEAVLVRAQALGLENRLAESAQVLGALLAGPGVSGGDREPAWARVARYELAVAERALGKKADAAQRLEELARSQDVGIAADAHYLLGQDAADAGKYAEAIPHLEAYLRVRRDGEAVESALARLALARLETGQAEGARQALTELGRRAPGCASWCVAVLKFAEREMGSGKLEEAEKDLRGVIELADRRGAGLGLDPRVVARAWEDLGRVFYRQGKPAEAAQALERAFAGLGGKAKSKLAIAQAFEAAGLNEKALTAYDAYLAGNKGDLPAALARARLLVRMKRPAEAAKAYESLAAKDLSPADQGKQGASQAAVLAEWAYALLDDGKPREADRIFERILAEHGQAPEAIEARLNLAESASERGDWAACVALLEPAVALLKRPGDPGPAAGKTAGAAGKTAAGTVGRDEAILFRLGRAYAELKRWDQAALVLDRLLADGSRSSLTREAKYLRGLAYEEQGQFAQALALDDAILAEPAGAADPPGLANLAAEHRIACLTALKRYDEALAELEKRGREQPAGPRTASLDFYRGQALKGLGRLDEARAAFGAAAGRKAGEISAQARLMVGETFFLQQRFAEALREFLKVDILEDAPRWQAAALLEAGKVQERIDQPEAAAETYERLIRRFPGDPAAQEARRRKDALTRKPAATAGSGGR